MTRRILVTGGSGQLGTALARLDWPADALPEFLGSAELDIAEEAMVASRLTTGRYAAVINAAAYTAVDKAESESVAAFRVNAIGPAILASRATTARIPLIHLSTDYVFAGDGKGPYREDDPVGPVSVYGASKLAGELAVRSCHPRATIIRTAWLISPFGSNFVRTMLRLGSERSELRVVDDQHGCPTSALDLARAIRLIVLRQAGEADAPFGTYHFVNDGTASWYALAREIFDQAGALGGPRPKVTGITTAEFPTAARRPANSCLSTERLHRDYGIRPRPWREGLTEILAELVPVQEVRS